MKTIVDAPEFANALFKEFGPRPDDDPAVLEVEETMIRHVTTQTREGIPVVSVAPGIFALHIHFRKEGHPHELIVTFSESETELFRLSLLVVPVSLGLAA